MMPEEIAYSLAGFNESVARLERRLETGERPVIDLDPFWYRGVDNGSYTLTPSLYRYRDPIEKERSLLGLHEQSALEEFGGKPVSWERVIHMQHYNIPTRLLDWTANLWIAVFFALTATPIQPCIYILNPRRLNHKSRLDGLVRVPEDPQFDFEEHFFGTPVLSSNYPLAITPRATNDRLRQQDGRFTVQGRDPEPLERQAPECVARINLDRRSHSELRAELRRMGIRGPRVLPDHEGVAQFVRSEAHLEPVPYDENIASRIRYHLQDRTQHDLYVLTHRDEDKEPYSKGVAFCNLDKAYLNRKTEAARLRTWLRDGPPLLFITGEAGVGKTNFTLHTLLCRNGFREKPSVFFSFKLYGTRASAVDRGDGEGELVRHLYDIMFTHKPSRQEQYVARHMISEGDVILALDGLDELARVQSEEAVEKVARELDGLFGGSPKARVMLTCRDHIYGHLHGMGALGSAKNRLSLRLEPFPTKTIRTALRRYWASPPKNLVDMATVPLFYEMIRRAQDHWSELMKAGDNRTRLEEVWFKIILAKNGHSPAILGKLGTIAGKMLHDRSDLLDAARVGDEFRSLLRGLSGHPFALFVEELKDKYAFSHQSLREFVLAWCVAQEVKTRSFQLLKSSGSFDYEGHEFYDRVRELLDIEDDVINPLAHLLRTPRLEESERNNLIRNLFEMLGELTPSNNSLAKRIAEAALPYLKPAGHKDSYVTYKTRYNIVRCLERIHWSAPRPYIKHIQSFRWWWNHEHRPPHGRRYLHAHVIRGFHRPKQEVTSSPPIVYIDKRTPRALGTIEGRVADHLLAVIEGLKEPELHEDGTFLGINCALALIRWLPKRPNVTRIEALLGHPQMTRPMKQNLFYALFMRYQIRIPDRFRKSGLFRDAGILTKPSLTAQAAFRRLTT